MSEIITKNQFCHLERKILVEIREFERSKRSKKSRQPKIT